MGEGAQEESAVYEEWAEIRGTGIPDGDGANLTPMRRARVAPAAETQCWRRGKLDRIRPTPSWPWLKSNKPGPRTVTGTFAGMSAGTTATMPNSGAAASSADAQVRGLAADEPHRHRCRGSRAAPADWFG